MDCEVRSSDEPKNNWVRLNVGGKVFQTTRQTLTKEATSFLNKLCCHEGEGISSYKDETGAYLIDRDPRYFGPILNYLRHGKLVIDPGLSDEGVLEEAEFYNLPHLVTLINERINARTAHVLREQEVRNPAAAVRSVYRVLQCHEEELTNMVSAMSDGWKLVQVLPVNSFVNFSNDQQKEYLCIVVRECPDVAPAAGEGQDRAGHIQQRARNN